MTPHPIDTAARGDDFEARARRIRGRILDGIEETLDELAQPRVRRAAIDHQVQDILQAHRAASLCRQALCRRAKRCRSEPCKIPTTEFQRSD